jgi:hypothetical protein
VNAPELASTYAEQLDDIADMLVRAGILTREEVGRHGVRSALRRVLEPPPQPAFLVPQYYWESEYVQLRKALRALLEDASAFRQAVSPATADQEPGSFCTARALLEPKKLERERSGARENGSRAAPNGGEAAK